MSFPIASDRTTCHCIFGKVVTWPIISMCGFIFQECDTHRKTRYDHIKADGEKIHALVQENLEYFQVGLIMCYRNLL